MGLTAAERAKRYRERLKKEQPEKFEEQRKKQLKRLQKYRKKITDLTENEKKEQRKKWREEKKRTKSKQVSTTVKNFNNDQMMPQSAEKDISSNHSFKIRYEKMRSKYNAALKKIHLANMKAEAIRKKYYRDNIQHKKEVDKLLHTIEKLTVRQEILEISLRDTYGKTKSQKQKRGLKTIAVNEITKKAKSTSAIASFLGLRGRIRLSNKKLKPNKRIKDELEQFYIRDDISRSTAGKRETRTKDKKQSQIRYLTDTLQNLHQKYKDEGGQHSFTTFYRYKPFYILSPLVKNRDTCLCIKHSNVEFLFIALKSNNIIGYANLNEAVRKVACDTKAYKCMYNKCDDCKTLNLQYKKEKNNEQVTWYKWERVTHSYEKLGKTLETKKTTKARKTGTVQELISEFEKELLLFKTHYYNWIQQLTQYQHCIKSLNNREIAILCDFSENYDSKLGTEIQSMHFGASKQSITLHCGMIYFHDQCQSFVSLSDNSCHEINAIWAHLLPIIKFAREINPQIEIVHFFSDGPSSQYRQKKNFYLTNLFTAKLNLSYSTWSFSESGHGKGVADGIGGSVKRQLDRVVAYGHDVKDANEAYDHLKKTMKSVKCFLVLENDIANIKQIIPTNITAVPETMKLHQIMSEQKGKISCRYLSCFCGDKHGLCDCFSPKVHIFPKEKMATGKIMPIMKNIETTILSGQRHVKDFATREILNGMHNESQNDLANNQVSVSDVNDLELQTDQDLIELKNVFNADIFLNDINLTQVEFQDITNIDVEVFNCSEVEQDNYLIDQDHLGLDSQPSTISNNVNKDSLGPLARPDLNSFGSLKRQPEITSPKNVKRVKVLKPQNRPKKSDQNEFDLSVTDAGGSNLTTNLKKTAQTTIKQKQMTPTYKSLRTIVSRKFLCKLCNRQKLSISHEMTKCIACKNWVCKSCSGDRMAIDYICDKCFESD